MLRARLLGALEVELDGAVIKSSASQRPWALFAYLALAAKPVSRAELVARFWPDVLDQSARASLRSALWALRRKLGDALTVDGDAVALNQADGLWIDVNEFARLAASDAAEALELARGELLDGCEDEWALAARERHRERVIELLEQLALAAETCSDGREAIELTRRQVERDPLDEAAHRRLIARLDAAGDRAGAVRTYKALAERLRRELGVAPAPQTRELAAQLRESPSPPAPTPAAIPLPGTSLPLLGRERELAELERTWAATQSGSGAAALIRGEAGIGKTRLANELRRLAAAAGAIVAAGGALDLGGSAPLSLWGELLGEVLPRVPAPPEEAAWPDDLSLLVPELPSHFGRAGAKRAAVAPDLQRTRLFEAVVALLGWACRDEPLLLIFEDVHSADAASLELAAYAARRIAGLRVMMLFTRRSVPQSPDADRLEHALRARGVLAGEIELRPLPQEPIATLARQTARLSDADVERVVERAEGNPLLAAESARALGQGQSEIAAGLRGSVRATLAQASPEARALAELAAVAARPLDSTSLRLLPIAEPEEAASAALQTGLLLSSEGGIGFRHALLRDAVYAEIAEPRRRSLHQRWAHVLLAAEEEGAAARPAEAARQLRLAHADAQAIPQLARAAVQARSLAALEQAVEYLAEALEIAPERAELWLERGELEAWRGRREQAESAFARAVELLEGGDPLVLARAWLQVASAYHGPICVPRLVRESAGNALELLDRTPRAEVEDERREALAAFAWAQAVAGSVDEAERVLAELSADAPAPDDLETYHVGHARALALMRGGRFTESYAPSIAAGEAITRAGRPDLAYGCWVNAASAASAAAEHQRALEFLDRGSVAIAGHGLASVELHLLSARSFVLRSLGQLDKARAVAATEQSLAGDLGQPELIAMASQDRGLVELEAGAYEDAARLLATSLVEGAPISRPLTRLALAEALARAGRPAEARAEVRAMVLEPVRPSDFPDALVPRLARVQGLIALAGENHAEARRRLEESVDGWQRLLERTLRADSITAVLADLGRPVVGLIDPERELGRVRGDLKAMSKGAADAVVP